jgi:telomerase reverse transcriptase
VSLLLSGTDIYTDTYHLVDIDTFVRLRRHETLTLHHLSHGFQLLDCHWLLPRNKRALYQRPNASEIQKRQSLLHELLYYIFDSFLIPLLRTNFYATESAAYRNRTVFFRQDDWNSITQPILEKLKQGCFTTISKNEAVGIMSGRQFGYSYVRLLPKLNGVRPIVNLRRRSIKVDRHHGEAAGTQIVQQQQSINNILNVTFHVLKYEKKCNVESMGSSVFGAQDIYDRMYEFKSRLMKKYKGHLPPLYFVKADVVCAFDSIDQKKLLEIVQDIICHVSTPSMTCTMSLN